MNMAAILTSILNKICQLIFYFLWSGCTEKNQFHLCRWDVVEKPKNFGGWGLRNLFLFNRYLAANTLWRVMTKACIWHTIIKYKYLPYVSVTTWFRTASTKMFVASQTWKNLLKSLPIITHWLSWSPRSGQAILIGKDLILGLGSSSLLYPNLLSSLNQRKLSFLYQAIGGSQTRSFGSYWKDSGELALSGD
jgi:hypothetical protein